MNPAVRKYLSTIGRAGGRASRRRLTADEARLMVKVREARRAYREFHAQCFWSYAPDLELTVADLSWVSEQLKKHGGSEAWRVAARLCR